MTVVEVVDRSGVGYPLGEGPPTIVPAGEIVVIVRDAPAGAEFRLDGRLRGVTAGREALLAVDLTRSTGFHHLHLAPGHDFWFGTDDAKLRLEGIERMLEYLRDESRSWTGQLLFADGVALRDPHVVYGWLDRHADAAIAAAHAIAAGPTRGITTEHAVRPAAGAGRVDLHRTIRLLRRRPRNLLEETTNGPIAIGAKRYTPRRVVTRRRRSTLDTPANRRCVWLLARVRELAQDVLTALTDAEPERARIHDWIRGIDQVLTTSSLSVLAPRAARGNGTSTPATEELVDDRYRMIREISHALSAVTAVDLGTEVRPSYSYVDYADQIYQAFVAHVIADALGAGLSAAPLGRVNPAFRSDDHDVYYNAHPEPSVLRTWRSYSATPDAPRPDLLVHHRGNGQVVLLDAKYRNHGARASESSRAELMAYLNAFGLHAAVICYPPEPPEALEVHRVESHGFVLVELPISPTPALQDFLADHLDEVLRSSAKAPAWRDG